MRHRKRNRSQMAAMDQINVTPLLDLTFLLLIAFMITMPLMEYGTNVSTPEMNSEALPSGEDENVASLELTRDSKYMLNGEFISADELKMQLKILSQEADKPKLLVRGDGACTYEEVIKLLALAKSCGFENAVLVTQAEDANK